MRSSLDSLLDAPATAQVRLMQSGVVKPSEILEGYIARVHQNAPYLNAVVDQDYEGARRSAREARAVAARRPAIPATLWIMRLDQRVHRNPRFVVDAGLAWRREMKAESDAAVVQQIREAGAIPFIASNGPEGGLWLESVNPLYGTTRNPWSRHRTPGGSSGGEGALISAACASFGIGSDVGGSIRIPAAFCGIFGHKPSSGILSTDGHFPAPVGDLSKYLCVGPMTRSAEDLTLLMRTLVPGLDDNTATRLPRAFYVVRSNSKVQADASLLAGLDDAGHALERAGITRREFPEGLLDDAVEIWFAMMSLSGSPEYARLLGQRPISPLRELLKFPLDVPRIFARASCRIR